jgi:hypothetical protein
MPGEEAEQRVEQQGERDRRDGIAERHHHLRARDPRDERDLLFVPAVLVLERARECCCRHRRLLRRELPVVHLHQAEAEAVVDPVRQPGQHGRER